MYFKKPVNNYSFLTCDEMTLKMWTQEPNQMYLDAKIYLGVEPLSIVCTPDGKIYVLTEHQVEVYDRLGVQIGIHDSENFNYLATGWGNYLIIGTIDGDVILMEPEHWH